MRHHVPDMQYLAADGHGDPNSMFEARRRSRTIVREKFMGRSSSFCPLCQPKPRNGRW